MKNNRDLYSFIVSIFHKPTNKILQIYGVPTKDGKLYLREHRNKKIRDSNPKLGDIEGKDCFVNITKI